MRTAEGRRAEPLWIRNLALTLVRPLFQSIPPYLFRGPLNPDSYAGRCIATVVRAMDRLAKAAGPDGQGREGIRTYKRFLKFQTRRGRRKILSFL